MIQHTEPITKPRQGYPWFQVKASEDVYHLRIPEIATASSLVAYYSGIVVAMQSATEAATKATEDISSETDLADIEVVSEHLIKAQQEMYGALGYVVLSCWRDPEWELVARTAWEQSYSIRKALRDGLSVESYDADVVSIVEAAIAKSRNMETDLKTAFGLMCWDELLCHGFSHEALQDIGTGCSRLIFESIKSKSGSGVELIADF